MVFIGYSANCLKVNENERQKKDVNEIPRFIHQMFCVRSSWAGLHIIQSSPANQRRAMNIALSVKMTYICFINHR